MTEYKDSKGVIHEIQGGFTAGDVIILSDDQAAWKVQRSILTDASPVFRDMFSSASTNNKEVNLPDASRAELTTFLLTISQPLPPTGLDLKAVTKTIDLLQRYECVDASRRVLYANARNLKADDLFDAFALASQLNDILGACRILTQGATWYDNPKSKYYAPPLHPDSITRPWVAADAERLQSSWVWALTLAGAACEEAKGRTGWFPRDPKY